MFVIYEIISRELSLPVFSLSSRKEAEIELQDIIEEGGSPERYYIKEEEKSFDPDFISI